MGVNSNLSSEFFEKYGMKQAQKDESMPYKLSSGSEMR